MTLRRQTKEGPTDAKFTVIPDDDLSSQVGSPLIADLEYQANQSALSIFGMESAPIRVHLFEEEGSLNPFESLVKALLRYSWKDIDITGWDQLTTAEQSIIRSEETFLAMREWIKP